MACTNIGLTVKALIYDKVYLAQLAKFNVRQHVLNRLDICYFARQFSLVNRQLRRFWESAFYFICNAELVANCVAQIFCAKKFYRLAMVRAQALTRLHLHCCRGYFPITNDLLSLCPDYDLVFTCVTLFVLPHIPSCGCNRYACEPYLHGLSNPY